LHYIHTDGSSSASIQSFFKFAIYFLIFVIYILFGVLYFYHINDPLGNTRVVLNEDGSVKEYYDYYPFGKIQRSSITDEAVTTFEFTGKELDDENDLNWYDFGARPYDSEIGRFVCGDPHADSYPSLTPYHYCGNNPLVFIDPTGMDSTFYVTNLSNEINTKQHEQIVKQLQKDLSDNSIPMKAMPLKIGEFIPLDKTDVKIDLVTDKNSLIKKLKVKNPDAEGFSPVGSGLGITTTGVMKRKGVDITGMGNLCFHEGLHGMGLSHKTHGEKRTVIYPAGGSVTVKEINNPNQAVSKNQRIYIKNVFLKK
jgi:RHS repeat-associated protein